MQQIAAGKRERFRSSWLDTDTALDIFSLGHIGVQAVVTASGAATR